jgi:hypothetical protein
MASELQVIIDFVDGRPSQTRAFPFDYAPGQEKQACAQLLGAIVSTGGVMDFGADCISLTPLVTCKLVTVRAPAIVAGDLCDLRKLDAAVNQNKVRLQ